VSFLLHGCVYLLTTFTIRFNNFIEKILCRYIYYQWTHEQKQSIKKTLVCNLWFVGKSVSNKYTDEFTDRKNLLKKYHSFYSVGISISKFNMSSKRKLYVMSSVFLLMELLCWWVNNTIGIYSNCFLILSCNILKRQDLLVECIYDIKGRWI